jgi:hypothetical protein
VAPRVSWSGAWIAPISSRRGSAPQGDDLHRALRRDAPSEPPQQHVHLFFDEGLQGAAVGQGVVHGEPERLLIAAGAEA